MLNFTETIDRTLPSPLMTNRRRLLLVDRAAAHPRLLGRLQQEMQSPPERAGELSFDRRTPSSSRQETILLWIVTPSALMCWGAFLAEPPEDRTAAMAAALGEHMEEARRRLVPLQRAGEAAGLNIRIRIAHGALLETLVRVAREEIVEAVLLATPNGDHSDLYGYPAAQLQAMLAQRLACPVERFCTI